MDKRSYVYILASTKNGTLYIGVTADLIRRVWQHREDAVEGFTQQYAIHTLVYFETFSDIREAIAREKTLKHWNRDWKLRLIEEHNPKWRDLYADLTGCPPARA
ncbi:MAG: GIY-YIG nuclease family protein [Gammaproteobacteria bacterium]|nr:GIY-YIG nuclease family protein [Gammaproteobacteria bacterium]